MIRSVSIKNWKAFENDTPHLFSEGLNLFVGSNGSGKTTLLEGICLGLTGTCSIQSFEELIRDQTREASVEVSFKRGSEDYIVRRSFSARRKYAELTEVSTQKKYSTWNGVNDRVLEILGVDATFFNRLIYMSEGEVQKCLSSPPQKALAGQLRVLFGLASIDLVTEAADKMSRELRRQIEDSNKQLQFLKDVPEQETAEVPKLENEISELRAKQKASLEKAEGLKSRTQVLDKTEHTLKEILEGLSWFAEWAKGKAVPEPAAEPGLDDVKVGIATLRNRSTEQERQLSSSTSEKGSVTADVGRLIEIRRLLTEATGPDRKVVPCPVCKRPIDDALARSLFEEIDTSASKLDARMSEVEIQMRELEESRRRTREDLARLVQFSDRINHLLKQLPSGTTFESTQFRERLEQLQREKQLVNDSLVSASAESSGIAEEIAAKERRLAGMVEANKRVLLKKDLEGKFIGSYRASLLLESVGEVLQDLRRSRQNLNMEEVYGHIADLWNRFRPDARWTVEFDADGNFALKAKGKKIRYAHLSGGEKTVLLVLARAILSKTVADIDFLLIDEPLEHLDVRNRRSLLNFLRGLALQRVIPQIVVTTFDETLTRHFRVASDVNLVFLGHQKPVFQA
jgi:exonuclease SbcC